MLRRAEDIIAFTELKAEAVKAVNIKDRTNLANKMGLLCTADAELLDTPST